MFSYSEKPLEGICYELLIAKSNAYYFDEKVLKLIYDYLIERYQKIKVDLSFSSELDISYGVPQRSTLGNLLFNIDICDLFCVDITSDIVNYADKKTPYKCDQHRYNLKKPQNAIFSYHLINILQLTVVIVKND